MGGGEMGGPMDLVTGGGGFIGRHVVRELDEAGRRVRVLDLAERPGGDAVPDGVEWVRGSVLERSDLRGALAGVERVFHLAGTAQLWAADRGVFERVNTGGTARALEAAREAGAGVFVHASSDVVALAAGRDFGAYVRSKVEAERIVRQRGEGIARVIVRPSAPIGPGDERLTPPTKMLRMLLTAPPPMYLDCVLDLVDVRDLAAGFVRAAGEARDSGDVPFVALGGHRVRFGELLAVVGAQGVDGLPRRRIPYAVALAAAAVETGLSRVTGREPTASLSGVRLARALEGAPSHGLPWGMAPRPLEETVRETVRWMREAGVAG